MEVGKVIGGRYHLAKLLGEGGMGQVWAATHLITKARVALKVMHGRLALNLEVRHRFLREARAAAAVRHPNVVSIHDVFEADGAPVIIMDYLVGESMGDLLVREKRLDVVHTAELLVPVLSAIKAAHDKGIVHRDLKPDNIFLEKREDGTSHVRVLDFGIAKLTATEGEAAKTAGITSTGSLLGTPYYMSPEQACGDKHLDGRSDIWSLGIILYECLAGVRPTEAATLGLVLKNVMTGAIRPIDEVVSGLPPQLVTCIGRMLSLEQTKRPSHAEVQDALERCRAFRGSIRVQPGAAAGSRREASLVAAGLADTSPEQVIASVQTIEPIVPKRSLVLPVAAVTGTLGAVALVLFLGRVQLHSPSPPSPLTAREEAPPIASSAPIASSTSSAVPSTTVATDAPPAPRVLTPPPSARPRAPSPATTTSTAAAPSGSVPPKKGKLVQDAPF